MAEEAFEKMPLTPWDEFPVHATPYPVSYMPSTDYAWDDGYYFLAYDVESQVQIWNGMRIAPNSNMLGAHATINIKGVQRAVRMSRVWRDAFSLSCGPLRYEIIEPMKLVRTVLEPNDSGMSFDILWRAINPPFLAAHHRAVRNGRRTTDQSRYWQIGQCTGWAEIDGKRLELSEDKPWGGTRDHSWGLYETRPPLGASSSLIAPFTPTGVQRAIHLAYMLESEGFTAFLQFHEGPEGERVQMNDGFGTPLEGRISRGLGDPGLAIVDYSHQFRWREGTRSVTGGELTLTDETGGVWKMVFEVEAMPHVIGQIGYHVGAWSDGGTINTYHGPGTPLEWDEADFSVQPSDHVNQMGDKRRVFGVEHIFNVVTTCPDGTVSKGRAQMEVFLNGRYSPYGFEAPAAHGHGLDGRGLA